VVFLNALLFSQGGMINMADYTQNLFRSLVPSPLPTLPSLNSMLFRKKNRVSGATASSQQF
jgi:hypothetical protein